MGGRELKARPTAESPTTALGTIIIGSRRSKAWLLRAGGLADRKTLHERQQAWADACTNTPHGKPVELSIKTRTDD